MFIGDREVKEVKESGEKTSGGIDVLEVQFKDGSVEWFSRLMYDETIAKERCDASALRERRVQPVVKVLLEVLRDWGIKISELTYISAVLNQSIDYNTKEALNELWSKWMPRPLTPDDVDLVSVDRVLKSRKPTLKDVIGNK